jgi:ribosomal protein S18 acetylase RimI-like enzyme
MNLIELEKNKYKGYKLKFEYSTDAHYKIEITNSNGGYDIKLNKVLFGYKQNKSFTDELFEDHWETPSAFGIFDDNDNLIAALELNKELWNNRIRITNIIVSNDYRRSGLGSLLIEKAKSIAIADCQRAIILETQSCNVNAIDFYLKHGFVLGGFDTTCYTNNDIEKGELRLEFVWINNKYLEQ